MTNENLPPLTFNTRRRTTSDELERQQPDPSESSSSTVKASDSSEEYVTAQLGCHDTIGTTSESASISSDVTDDSSSTNNTNAPASKKTRSPSKKPKKRVSKKNVAAVVNTNEVVASESNIAATIPVQISAPEPENIPNSVDQSTDNATSIATQSGNVSITVTAPKSVKNSNVIKAALEYQERTKKPEEVVTPLLESSKKTEQKIREKQTRKKLVNNNNVNFERAQSEYGNCGATNDIASYRTIHKSLSEGENGDDQVTSPAAEPRSVVITKTEPMDVKAFVTTINKNNSPSSSPVSRSSVGSPTKPKSMGAKKPTASVTLSTSEDNSKSAPHSNPPSKARSNSGTSAAQNAVVARVHSNSMPPPKQGTPNITANGPSTAPDSVMSTVIKSPELGAINSTIPEEPKVVQPQPDIHVEPAVVVESAVIEKELKLDPPPIVESSDSIKSDVAQSTPNLKFRSESTLPSSSINSAEKPYNDTPTRLASVLSPRRHQELAARPSTQNSIDDLILSALSKTAAKKADLPANEILSKLQKLQSEKNNK